MAYGFPETQQERVAMRPDQIAVQLYTLRELAGQDLRGTLRAVSAAGYRSVELAGLPAIEAEALRDLLATEGLQPIASHESIESLRAGLDGVLDRLAVLGCPRAIVPWLPEAERASVDGVRRFARELNQIAESCSIRGIRLGYHNHAFEFAAVEGTTVWDVLLDELSADVELELDVYWATHGGRDAVELIRSLDDRLRLLHMKDMASLPSGGDVTPGDGMLPWADIVAAGTDRGVEWYIVEEDNPKDAIAEITRGLRYLQGHATADA
jgi:sugar phosphate isomerase/epimerase